MNPFSNINRLSVLALVSVVGSAAQATPYSYTNAGNGGKIKSLSTYFNGANNQFEVSTTVTSDIQGYWLAVSPGPNPKGNSNDLALMYFDATDASSLKMTAYAYNGVNGGTSYFDGDPAPGNQAPKKILSSLNSNFAGNLGLTTNGNGTKTFSLSFDASPIQSYGTGDWNGVKFGPKIGVWFHVQNNLSTSYGNDGFLNNFKGHDVGWVDFSDGHAEAVPEPATMAVLGLGAIAMLKRRKKNA